jgi:hypothetical protein
MYDAERATIEVFRIKFDQQLAERTPEARATAAQYMNALSAFVDAFNDGPGADSHQMGSDTTGALSRIEENVVWAETERHRVRTALNSIA